jgi:phosphoribosylformimino-5-aminoimidazole carboxamide ribotide isomerase
MRGVKTLNPLVSIIFVGCTRSVLLRVSVESYRSVADNGGGKFHAFATMEIGPTRRGTHLHRTCLPAVCDCPAVAALLRSLVSSFFHGTMKFRPCIDLHQGRVKQIVGSTLAEGTAAADDAVPVLQTNFTADQPAAYFAELYQRDALTGGHVIMLGPGNTEAARQALAAYPGQLQVGGGVTTETAPQWLAAGASHVIVTSYVFQNGQIHKERLAALVAAIGKERLVLDLSCRKKPQSSRSHDDDYYVVTDKWQKFTDYPVTAATLQDLSTYCAEFLVHGVDVEGLQCGILPDLVALLGEHSPIPVTYAGGVRSLADLELVRKVGKNRVDCTVGSALDLFGGSLSYASVVGWHEEQQRPQQPQQPTKDPPQTQA